VAKIRGIGRNDDSDFGAAKTAFEMTECNAALTASLKPRFFSSVADGGMRQSDILARISIVVAFYRRVCVSWDDATYRAKILARLRQE